MAPSALAIRRITIDTKRVLEMSDSGLFWIPDETDITRGWAIICGGEGTPYDGGAFAFEVAFPDNYPFEPPTFKYLTNDGRTRFNPNLYKNGKVCLSLLNTWQGEKWSGVQSLGSVMQCIQSAVLIPTPLVNEPSHRASTDPKNDEIPIYTRMILHSVIETAILQTLADPPAYIVPIYDAIRDHVQRAKKRIIAAAMKEAEGYDGKVETLPFYSMTVRYKFAELAEQLATL
jgi:ubiquitin-conjugating enzyme E2 Z